MPPYFLHHIIFGNVTYTYFMYGIVWQSLPTWGMTWKYRRPACIYTYLCLCTCSYDGVQYTRVCVVIWIYTHNKHIHIRISSTAYMYAWPKVSYQEAYPNYHIVGGGAGGHYQLAPMNLMSPLSSSFALVNNLVSPLTSSFAPVNLMSPLIVKLINMLQRQLRRCTCSPSGPPRCHLRN